MHKFDSHHIHIGRGGKKNSLYQLVPLFILPFLIQSAVVPFIVTTILLYLKKSLFAGKIAILLMILGALKGTHNNYMKSFAHSFYAKDLPIFTPSFPERRFENFEGYKAEGPQAAMIS